MIKKMINRMIEKEVDSRLNEFKELYIQTQKLNDDNKSVLNSIESKYIYDSIANDSYFIRRIIENINKWVKNDY